MRKRFIEDEYYFNDEEDIIAYDKQGNNLSQDEIAELFVKYDGAIDIV
jgi:hypothetical protein